MMKSKRIGLFGGTFDPIHQGHLDVAEAAKLALNLDKVLLMPGRVALHRVTQARASSYHRFAMLALATASHQALLSFDFELSVPDPSYTSLTLKRMGLTGYKPEQLFFITGADTFADIATWYDYPAVLDLSHFVVVSRPGHPVSHLRNQLPDLSDRMRNVNPSPNQTGQNSDRCTIWLINIPTSQASSSEIRRRVTAGKTLSGLIHPEVESYIHRHELYSCHERATKTPNAISEKF